jgi:hypothetical protein
MFFIFLVSSVSVVSQFFKHFTKVEKNHYPVDSAIRPLYNRPQTDRDAIQSILNYMPVDFMFVEV